MSWYGQDRGAVMLCPEGPLHTANEMYTCLQKAWCAETCAPRMRDRWSQADPTLGQCSVTAFLVQDHFGGEVYGIPLKEGGFHCFNVIQGMTFDLTSEQFGDEELDYGSGVPQSRQVHFSKHEKKERYELLKRRLGDAIA